MRNQVNDIYLFKEMPKDLEENGKMLIEFDQLPEITRVINGAYSFYGVYKLNGQYRKEIKRNSYIKALWENGSWQYFKIYNVRKNLSSVSFTARHIGYDANRNFVQMSYTSRGNGKEIMANLKKNLAFAQPFNYESDIITQHQFTAKEVNPIDAMIGQNNGNQNMAGVLGGELDMDNYTLTMKERIGQDNGYRIDLGINLESIEEFIDDSSVTNSLYLVGGVPDDEDYNGDREEVTYAYLNAAGITDDNRRISKRENSNCKTKTELIEWGRSLFDKNRIHEPKVTHTVNMVSLEHTEEYGETYEKIASLHFGDTAHVQLNELDIEVQERMVEGVWYPTVGKWKSVVLGNDLGMYTDKVQTEQQEILKKLDNRSNELVGAIVNATQWITGTKGGYVRFRPKDAPSEILIMDRDKASEAKKVWRWNLGGLGFSNKGVNGPYETAITQDGAIVANFISVGKIQADVFQSSFNQSTGDVLKLVGGVLQIENNKIKIMELTKQGLEFWNGKNHVGTIGTKGNPFPELSDNNGHVITDGNSILLIGDDPKKIVGLSNKPNNGIAINGEQQFFLGSVFNFVGTGDNKGKGTIRCDRLFVGGKEIGSGTGSGGGGNVGGWDGQYPPQVTTSAEKFAWQAWVTLLSLGYSKAAAAGILGNINGEAGPSMNPDTEQVGGPAYGAVQFDGSSYPLIGAPTPNGREYFQRLHKASGAGGDYREMTPQMKVVDWGMANGQWIGKVAPASVGGFKGMTSPEQAAYVFEENYERPANAHPERQGYARNWYDKFVNLEIPKNNWKNPVRSNYVVTQEWDEPDYWSSGGAGIHGGIDLASVPAGSKPNVYAAKSGTVIARATGGLEGNYIMIDHGDGYYTYYGHLDSFNVAQGAKVSNDTVIGVMGTTGGSTGVHLHFEVRKGGSTSDSRVNPRSVINF